LQAQSRVGIKRGAERKETPASMWKNINKKARE
jgi:hypothetical protein